MATKTPFRFDLAYFAITILIFVVEVLIALFVKDRFVRPYLGDVLVVILIYCFMMSFLDIPILPVVIIVLLFTFTIEFLQYIDIVEKLGLQNSKIASTVIGTSFAWNDILAYIAGAVIVLIVEMWIHKKPSIKLQAPNSKES